MFGPGRKELGGDISQSALFVLMSFSLLTRAPLSSVFCLLMHQGRRGDVLVLDVGTERTNKAQKVESSVASERKRGKSKPRFIYLFIEMFLKKKR